jgi:hypothetical protein
MPTVTECSDDEGDNNNKDSALAIESSSFRDPSASALDLHNESSGIITDDDFVMVPDTGADLPQHSWPKNQV